MSHWIDLFLLLSVIRLKATLTTRTIIIIFEGKLNESTRIFDTMMQVMFTMLNTV